jgi:hypothetical protein
MGLGFDVWLEPPAGQNKQSRRSNSRKAIATSLVVELLSTCFEYWVSVSPEQPYDFE